MPRMHQTILVPGDQITNAMMLLQAPPVAGRPNVLAGPFAAGFNDGHRLEVTVVDGDPPHIQATLLAQDNRVVMSLEVAGNVDQDYILEDGDYEYELSILRAASTVLTPDAIAEYNKNSSHCPACGSPDIHGARPQFDGPTAWVRIECCSCGARWIDLYKFAGISEEPDDWESPTENVRRHTEPT